MPVVTVEISKLTKEQKATIVEKVASVICEVANVPEDAVVTIIRENDFDNIGSGKKLLSDKFGK